MQGKPLGLQMLWWLEVVVSLRALLFFAPVLINNWREQNVSSSSVDYGFLWVAGVSSFVYLVIGIASLLGHKLWRFFHVAAMLIVVALTFTLWNLSGQASVAALPRVYWLPLLWAIISIVGVYGFKMKPQQA